MLPYIHWSTIALGPLTIQVWGLFVTLAFLVCLWLILRRGRGLGLQRNLIYDLAFWILFSALLGGRLFYLLENLAYYQQHASEILSLWRGGMAISGGFIGALVAAVIILKIKRQPFWPYAELIVFSLPLGLAIGRLGCFFIFDHPGTPTGFFLGERYLDGVIRHNHGLYLSLFGLLLFIIFLLLQKYFKPQKLFPIYSIIFLFYDGLLRFSLDFYRILDSRLYGLTAAQYCGIGEFILAIILIILFYKKR